MKLHLSELFEGFNDAYSLYKQGENIFEMGNGNLIPTHTSQQSWQFAKTPTHIHFSDGNNTYSFRMPGELGDTDMDIEKDTDIPLPDMFTHATAKGRAQLHRSDPGSMYFTLQQGTKNPTYTFRHTGGKKWRAIPKPKKEKPAAKLKTLGEIPNLDAHQFKQGMEAELQTLTKEAVEGQGFFPL